MNRRHFSLERELAGNLAADQKSIWTSPLRLRLSDAQWLVPLLGGTAILAASDADIQRRVPTDSNFQRQSNKFSNYGVAAFAGIGGASWLLGMATKNDELREAGFLSGEAALDSLAVTYAIKSVTRRDRPFEGNHHGSFFSNGDSFPSEHAAAAWSVATVFAHEHPSFLTNVLAYGGAAAISAARVGSNKHFAADAMVGSALGYFVGRQVYRAHHADADADLDYGTFERTADSESSLNPANMGSTFVPLDSWVYSAFDRLAAMGYIDTAFAGMRPWTRMECARLVDEAANRIDPESAGAPREAYGIYQALQREFTVESRRIDGDPNVSAEVDSIYTRLTGISGRPLNDSYHFGQTITNDYGRPYEQGFNAVTGFTSRAEAGPLAFYVRGEYQHSPAAPSYPLNVRNAIARMDVTPVAAATPIPTRDAFQLLDTYAALDIDNNQISFGRQSLWWGPGKSTALMFTDNALPMYMLRWSRVTPFTLPSLFRYLGPVKTEFFLGRLEGHHYPSNPYISAQKFSFKPTENLEFGFSKVTVFAGGKTPLSWHGFYRATASIGEGSGNPNANSPGIDPGDRRAGFDFSYRLPGLRNWLTFYSDSLVDDDPSPLAAPRRAAFNPGLFLSHVPSVPKLDLRVEAVNTDTSSGRSVGGQFIYWNVVYRDSHTNAGNIMGSWIGREGTGYIASSTYWLSPRNTVAVRYRKAKLDRDFVPGGATLDDLSINPQLTLRSDLDLQASVQVERWKMPLLDANPQTNVTASIQITYRPSWRVAKGSH